MDLNILDICPGLPASDKLNCLGAWVEFPELLFIIEILLDVGSGYLKDHVSPLVSAYPVCLGRGAAFR